MRRLRRGGYGGGTHMAVDGSGAAHCWPTCRAATGGGQKQGQARASMACRLERMGSTTCAPRLAYSVPRPRCGTLVYRVKILTNKRHQSEAVLGPQ